MVDIQVRGERSQRDTESKRREEGGPWNRVCKEPSLKVKVTFNRIKSTISKHRQVDFIKSFVFSDVPLSVVFTCGRGHMVLAEVGGQLEEQFLSFYHMALAIKLRFLGWAAPSG